MVKLAREKRAVFRFKSPPFAHQKGADFAGVLPASGVLFIGAEFGGIGQGVVKIASALTLERAIADHWN